MGNKLNINHIEKFITEYGETTDVSEEFLIEEYDSLMKILKENQIKSQLDILKLFETVQVYRMISKTETSLVIIKNLTSLLIKFSKDKENKQLIKSLIFVFLYEISDIFLFKEYILKDFISNYISIEEEIYIENISHEVFIDQELFPINLLIQCVHDYEDSIVYKSYKTYTEYTDIDYISEYINNSLLIYFININDSNKIKNIEIFKNSIFNQRKIPIETLLNKAFSSIDVFLCNDNKQTLNFLYNNQVFCNYLNSQFLIINLFSYIDIYNLSNESIISVEDFEYDNHISNIYIQKHDQLLKAQNYSGYIENYKENNEKLYLFFQNFHEENPFFIKTIFNFYFQFKSNFSNNFTLTFLPLFHLQIELSSNQIEHCLLDNSFSEKLILLLISSILRLNKDLQYSNNAHNNIDNKENNLKIFSQLILLNQISSKENFLITVLFLSKKNQKDYIKNILDLLMESLQNMLKSSKNKKKDEIDNCQYFSSYVYLILMTLYNIIYKIKSIELLYIDKFFKLFQVFIDEKNLNKEIHLILIDIYFVSYKKVQDVYHSLVFYFYLYYVNKYYTSYLNFQNDNDYNEVIDSKLNFHIKNHSLFSEYFSKEGFNIDSCPKEMNIRLLNKKQSSTCLTSDFDIKFYKLSLIKQKKLYVFFVSQQNLKLNKALEKILVKS